MCVSETLSTRARTGQCLPKKLLFAHHTTLVNRVGQNRIYTPYMTVYFLIFLPRIPYIHRIYMVLANPTCEVVDVKACVGNIQCA